ncbi:SLBB domain-containing protein [bacterium]|nr:SLBB domain-containing protein [bacterium]
MAGQTAAEKLEQVPEQKMQPAMQEILFDKKVDPDKYIVGPSDVIGVYLWGELDREYTNYVTPEGYLILPTIGQIMVADKTLTEVREIISNAVKKQYKDIDTTIYLSRPRMFRLSISGLVLNAGMISANSLERVSDVIDRAGLMYVEKVGMLENIQNISVAQEQSERALSSEQMTTQRLRYERQTELGVLASEANLMKRGSSQRSITVYRGDIKIDVDLLRFRKLGDIDDNPYVAAGDYVFVPQYNGDMIISGEVNDPGRYEWKSSDRIADLVAIGGGLTVLADTTRATLVRFGRMGQKSENIDIDLYDALLKNPDDPKYLIEESDRLFVRQKYNYKVIASIRLDGQVTYPGEYAITPGVTTLNEIITMAGGFTDLSNLEEARLVRRVSSATQDLEYERLRRMQRWEMTPEEYDYYKSRSRTIQGEITIDFVKLFIDKDMTNDVVLQNGDAIFIPFKRELVNVSGAVNEPGYVKIEPGQDIHFYIAKAGGFKWDADSHKVRIVKAKTGQRLRPGGNVLIEGGDIIHVSEKTPINTWEVFRDSAQIFANVATIIILAKQITKL